MPKESVTNESRAIFEYWALQTSSVVRGVDVPKGDGKVVLVLPGLFANDMYLTPMRRWLSRIGYQPHMSRIALNAGCPKRLLAQVQARFQPQISKSTRDIAIIGHSRGGLLGKALVSRLGERVSHFIAVGSPLGLMLRLGKDGLADISATGSSTDADVAHQSVVDAGRAAMRLFDPDCDAPLCGCEYIEDLLAPWPQRTKVTAIYSSDDPIVSAAACPIDGGANISVTGTHSGLVFNAEVFRHIGAALAE